MHIQITPNADLPPDLLADFDRRGKEIFTNAGADLVNVRWSGGDIRLIVWEGDTWVSCLELLERDIRVGDLSLRVGGVSGVMTPPEHRGKGYASTGLRRGTDYLCQEMGLAYGLLVTGAHLIPFYSALGWFVVPGPLAYHQDGERRQFKDDTIIMVYSCSGAAWPPGLIDVQGLPW